jgi:hypothetical protein
MRAKCNTHTLPNVIRIERYEEGDRKDNILHRWYLSLIYAPCLSPIVLGKGKAKRSVQFSDAKRERAHIPMQAMQDPGSVACLYAH